MKKMFLILSLTLSFFSCNDSKNDDPFPQDVAFTTISNNALRGSGSEGILQSNKVINNTDDWQNLITKMNSINNNMTDNFSETDTDFEDYLIIAVFLEVKSSDWSIEIAKITENENSLLVTTNENESIASVITQPFSIVKIRRTEKTIEFE
jgi:hypothetical protein